MFLLLSEVVLGDKEVFGENEWHQILTEDQGRAHRIMYSLSFKSVNVFSRQYNYRMGVIDVLISCLCWERALERSGRTTRSKSLLLPYSPVQCMDVWNKPYGTLYQLLPIPFVSYLHSLYHTVRTLSNVYQITVYDRILSASLKSLARNVPDRRSHSIEACSDKAEWLQMCFHDVWWKHLPSRALKFYISITLQWVTWLVLKLSWVLRSSYKNDMYTIHVPVGHGSEVSLLGIFFVWAHVPDDL